MPKRATAKFTLNDAQLLDDLSKGRNGTLIEIELRLAVRREITDALQELNNQFEEHPITKELELGISASNISGTLRGYGNLFSFMGFYKTDKPISPIRKELQTRVTIESVKLLKRGRVIVDFEGPSLDAIFKETPLPWSTDSWARRVERGIAGFGRYLVGNFPNSRSTIAIQSNQKKATRPLGFKNQTYLSKMFRDFNKRLNIIN